MPRLVRPRPALVLAVLVAGVAPSLVRGEEPAPNTLTAEEEAAGWRLLFDGRSTAGWRGYQREDMPPGWQVIDGALVRVRGGAGGKGAGGGDDIVTTENYDNFELELEWKIVAGGNSGVLFRVSEEPVTAWHEACEVQVLDNAPHPTRNPKQLAGALYDLYEPAQDVTRPAGEWNRLRLVVDGPHVEHWLNGEKVVEYEIGSADWRARQADSKFRDFDRYATHTTGPLCLQDHSDQVSFRSIKLRPLPARAED